MRQRHAEGDRKRRLLALKLTERGGAICTKGHPASPHGSVIDVMVGDSLLATDKDNLHITSIISNFL